MLETRKLDNNNIRICFSWHTEIAVYNMYSYIGYRINLSCYQ